jgi:hypothetical protein
MQANAATDTARRLARIVIRGLAAGQPVEIEGLGVFYPDPELGCRFEPRVRPRVFIAYAREDREAAERLYGELTGAGLDPWMDSVRLLPGQNWPRAIESAIESSDFFIACFSENSANKRGGFQAEIRYALDCARRMPLDEIFVIPIRLNACRVPRAIQREIQYIDMFPSWRNGLSRLTDLLRQEGERKQREAGGVDHESP